jgi:hypothetical protein
MKNHLKYFSLFFLALFPGIVLIAQNEVPESEFFSSIRANQIDSYAQKHLKTSAFLHAYTPAKTITICSLTAE